MTTPSVLLLNDTTDWYHFGCAATSCALKEEITKLGYKLTAVPITETYKIRSVHDSLEGFLNPDSFEKFADDNPALLELVKTHDALIINGEGTLHGLRQAPRSLLYTAYAAKRFLGKHVEIINHSVYPNNLSLSIYKLVYQLIDFIAIREPRSLSLMQQLGIKATSSFDCLPVYIKHHYHPRRSKRGRVLLVAGSASWLELNIPSSNTGNIANFARGIDGLISYLENMASRGYDIKFLYGAPAYPAKDDREFIQFVEQRLKVRWAVVTATSIDDWLEHIETADLLISGRFHHTIAAACLGTPFVALESNTPKMHGLMDVLGGDVISFADPSIMTTLMRATERALSYKQEVLLDKLVSLGKRNFIKLITFLHTTHTNS
jgi:polysaccharide pyruvyl transferase WcaK-like protein